MIAFDGKLKRRDRDILERVYRRTSRALLAFAYDMLKDHNLAEDVVQESFVRLANNLDKIDDPESDRTFSYMFVIVKNVIFTDRYKRSRAEEVPYEDYDLEEDEIPFVVEEFVLKKEQYALLKEAIKNLPQKLREPLVLFYFGQFKIDQIADMMEISPTNAGVRIHRARNEIKKYIERKEEESDGRGKQKVHNR